MAKTVKNLLAMRERLLPGILHNLLIKRITKKKKKKKIPRSVFNTNLKMI